MADFLTYYALFDWSKYNLWLSNIKHLKKKIGANYSPHLPPPTRLATAHRGNGAYRVMVVRLNYII